MATGAMRWRTAHTHAAPSGLFLIAHDVHLLRTLLPHVWVSATPALASCVMEARGRPPLLVVTHERAEGTTRVTSHPIRVEHGSWTISRLGEIDSSTATHLGILPRHARRAPLVPVLQSLRSRSVVNGS